MGNNAEDLRKEVERSIAKMEKAPVRQEVRTAKVVMNIHPDAIPRTTLNPSKLIEGVAKLFGSRFDPSELMKLIPTGVSRDQLSHASLLQMALDADKNINFIGGTIRFPDLGRVTQIERVGFGQQVLIAVVVGTTNEAVLVAKQLCLEIWKAAGIERNWSEIASFVERQSFTTTTVVDLGFPLSKLLDPRFSNFFQNELIAPEGLGRQMGIQEADPARQKQTAKDLMLIPYCRGIHLQVAVIDSVSGRAEDTDLQFMIYSRTEANRSRALISSELTSEKHAELVQRVVAVLST